MPTRSSLDLFKRYRSEYVAPRQPRLINIEPAHYLTFDCDHAANTLDTEVLERVLYSVVSALRPVCMANHQRDFIFGKLELMLSSDVYSGIYLCKVMMRIPDFITGDDLAHAQASVLAREMDVDTAYWVRQAHLEWFAEGLCTQMLHAGPCDLNSHKRGLAVLSHFASTQNLEVTGSLHAVYLASTRRVSPEHRRMLLRLPVRIANVAECMPASTADMKSATD